MGKIGYVVKRYPRYSETFIVNEILAHERSGLDLTIFALRPPTDTHFQSIVSDVRAPVRYLDVPGRTNEFWGRIARLADHYPRMWAELSAARRLQARDVYQAVHLVELVAEERITHLHAHFATSATDVARLASRISGIPYTFTAHAKDIFHEEVDAVSLKEKLLDAKTVVTVSDYNVDFLQRSYGPAASRLRRIYNGLDLGEFSFTPPDRRKPLVLAVGRLVEKKGFSVLIRACALMRQAGTPFECRIVGDGDQRPQLQRLIEDLGLEDAVELVGPRPRRDVIEWIRQAAVLAAPCVVASDGNQDGLPTVLLESMALGTPCVSTDVTGIPEIVRDRDTGLMVDSHDDGGLATAITELLLDADLRCRLAARARALVESDFDIGTNTAALRKLFEVDVAESHADLSRRVSLGKVA